MKFNIVSLNKFGVFNELFKGKGESLLSDDSYNIIMVQESRTEKNMTLETTYKGKTYTGIFGSTGNALPNKNTVGMYAQDSIFAVFSDSRLGTVKVPTLAYDDEGKMFKVENIGILINIPMSDTCFTVMSLHSTPTYQHTYSELLFVTNKLKKYNGYWMFIAEFDRESAECLLPASNKTLLDFKAERISESDFYCISSTSLHSLMEIKTSDNNIGDPVCSITVDIPLNDDIN